MLLALLSGALVAAVTTSVWLLGQDAVSLVRSARSDRRWGLFLVVLVAALTLFAFRLRWQIVPHHAMYLDEPWYLEAAHSLVRWGKPLLCEQQWDRLGCVPYPKALGWPLVLASTFPFTGADDLAAIRLTTVLGTLTVPLAALCARSLGGTRLQSLFAALLIAIHPAHIAWSATAETNVPGAFFVLLALLGLARAERDGTRPAWWLASSALCMATAIRPETALLFLPAAAVLLRGASARRTKGRLVAAAGLGLSAVVAVAAIVPMWRLNSEIARESGFLAFARIAGSLRALPAPALAYPAFLVGLALVALVGRRSLLVLSILAAGFGQLLVGLAFHQFDARLLLSGAITLVPLAAMFPGLRFDGSTGFSRDALVEWLSPAVSALAIGWWAVGAVGAAESPNVPDSQTLETRLPSLVHASVTTDQALVVAEMPAVFAYSSPAPVMATKTALSKGAPALAALAAERPVHFVCDMYCEAGFGGAMAPAACGAVLRDFDLETITATELHGRRYGVYRVRGLRKSDVPVTRCP